MDSHIFEVLPWNDGFNTGIPLIDEQHKGLVLLLNQLAGYLASRTDGDMLNSVFDRLANYAVFHFETEEAMWHRYLGDDIDVINHHQVHADFIDTVIQLRYDLKVKPAEAVAESTLIFLARWLASHILESDRKLALIVLSMMSGSTLEVAKVTASREKGNIADAFISLILAIHQTQSTNTIKLMREIASHRRTEVVLRETQRRYERAISGTEDGLWDWVLATGDAYYSPRWKELLGFQVSELANRQESFFQCVDPTDEHRIRLALSEHIDRGAPYNVEIRLRCKNGDFRWFFMRGQAVLDSATQLLHMSGFMTDITEHKLMAQELDRHRNGLEALVAERTRELALAKTAAEEATVAKSAFLANMSHEIRTPLNTVIGFVHLMRKDVETPIQRDRLEKVGTAASHLLGLVNDVLDFSKLESAKLELHDEVFELVDLMQYVRDIVWQRIEGKAINIAVEIDPAIPKLLLGDRLRLAQILTNFASNAGKFTEHGFIFLRVKQTEPTLVNHTRMLLRFEIEDSGIGLTLDQQKKIFQPFVQADASITRRFGGTGLGLALSRSIATSMGGSVGVESESGRGSLFWLELSLGCTAHSSMALEKKCSISSNPKLSGKILLVEDNFVNQELAKELLFDMGLDVDVADDGLQALERCRDTQYDVILMDMQMPRMDGLTATRMLRENKSFSIIPILAMTANSTQSDRQECLDAGMDDFITKPIDPDLLECKLTDLLIHKSTASS